MTKTMSEDYAALVAEAFIDPIRSVLIVDDDYPTLDEILDFAISGEVKEKYSEKSWRRNPKEVLSVVQEFRQPDSSPYILDIHDGDMPPPGTDEHQAHRLQQTDLLVLDYELNGTVRDGGEKALAIARKALTNEHFNIILVHTREPLEQVFNRFLIGLLQPMFGEPWEDLDQAQQDAIEEHLHEASASMSDAAYLEVRRSLEDAIDQLKTGSGPLVQLYGCIKDQVDETLWKPLLKMAAHEFERKALKETQFSDQKIEVRTWREAEHLWIRCDQGFVAFKKKGDGVPLLQTLHETLVSWKPYPSRLLLTKLRAVMNEKGIEVQDDALGDGAVGAAWFHDLVAAGEAERAIRVEQVVRNHSEQLLDQLLPGVAHYAKRLANAFQGSASEKVRKAFDGFDMDEKGTQGRAVTARNAFAASKPIGGIHLEFGHLLEIDGSEWLCLTPACDMVPGVRRNQDFEPDDLEGYKRFTALRLHAVPSEKINRVLKEAQRAEHVFINIIKEDGSSEAMVFALKREPKAAPATMVMYAENDGRFCDRGPILKVRYVTTDTNGDASEDRRHFVLVEKQSTVRGHLRYEYALHIQAMFAQGLSRIGLDYVPVKT